MAELTTQLEDINYTPPIRDPGANANGTATALNFFGNALETFSQSNRERSAKKAEAARLKRQQDADARDAQGRDAYKQTVLGFQDINAGLSQPQEVQQPDTGINLDVNSEEQASGVVDQIFGGAQQTGLAAPLKQQVFDTAGRIKSIETAASQGRMPAISVTAETERLVRGLLNKYPDSAQDIIKAMGDIGVKSSFLQDIQDEQAQHKFTLEEGQKFEQSNYELGMKVTPTDMLPNMTREQVIAAGIAAGHQEYQLEQLTKQAELQSKQTSTDVAARNMQQEDLNKGIAQNLVINAYNTAGPIMASLNKQLVTIRSLPQQEQAEAFNAIGAQINAISQRQINEARAKAVAAGMDPAKVEGFVSQVSGVWNQAKGMFSGDFSVAQQQMNTLNNFKNGLKLQAMDSGKMMRAYFGLQQLGFSRDVLDNFVTGIGTDPKLMADFRSEVMGFVEDFDNNRASSRILRLGALLRGEGTLAGADSNTLREQLPALMKTTLGNAQSYINNRSPDTGDAVLNGVSNIVIATQTLTPSSGVAAFQNATTGFAGPVPRAAIAIAAAQGEGGMKEEARQVVIASQAASARMLDLMRPGLTRANVNGWAVKFNERTGKYEADGSKARMSPGLAAAASLGEVVPSSTSPLPDSIRQWVSLANTHLENVTRLNAPQINDNPIKGTSLEVATFFATDKPTKAMLKEQEQGSSGRSAAGQARDAVRGIQDALDRELGRDFEPISSGADRVMNYEAAAAGFKTVPSSIQTLGDASDFAKSVNKAGVASSAMGTFQITGETMRDFAPKVLGANWREQPYTAETQTRLAEAIFNASKGSAEALRNRWVSLSLAEAEQVRKMPVRDALQIIAQKESGGSVQG